MLSSSPTFAFAFGALLLASTAAGCGSGTSTTGTGGMGGAGTGGAGTGGAATGGAATGGAATGGTGGTGTGGAGNGGAGGMWTSDCHDCLQDHCKVEIAACDEECLAIQACIDAVCGNLSKIGAAAQEGQCQVQCQAKHASGKQKHINLVNCAQGAAACMPPCKFAIYDWEQCSAGVSGGSCKPALKACNDSAECQTYQTCASACFDNAGCQACAAGADGQKGEKLYEAYWQCVETTCITEAWLQQF